jgi:HTH-type transcriptional regulator, transcriptional repressor of NAD biosynthesis genes
MNAVKRIVVFGPESTGKTTLARRLAEYLGEPWAEEFVREFWDIRGGKIIAEDLGTIALGQIANEDRAAAAAQRAVVCDTDLLTCVLWNDVLFPEKCPAWVREEAEVRVRSGGLFLFCDTDAAWTPDPQRCFPDEAGRAMCRRVWREALSTRAISCVELHGDWPEREATAIRAVAEFLKA